MSVPNSIIPSNPMRGAVNKTSELPITGYDDTGLPAWQEISRTLGDDGVNLPQHIRDELAGMLVWARYAKNIATPAPEPQPEVAAEPDAWMWMHPHYTGGEWTQCGPLSDRKTEGAKYRPFYATPPVVEEAVKADDGKVLVAPYDRVMIEGEGDTLEYQLVPTSMIDTYREVIKTLRARSATP